MAASTPDFHIHVLRNPWGHSEEVVRDARLWACDEIERLQRGLVPLPSRPSNYVNRAGILASDMPAEVVRKLDLAWAESCTAGPGLVVG